MPCERPRNIYGPLQPQEWLFGTPIGLHRTGIRLLNTLAPVPTRTRPKYGMGRGGQLGLSDQQVGMGGDGRKVLGEEG